MGATLQADASRALIGEADIDRYGRGNMLRLRIGNRRMDSGTHRLVWGR